MYEINVAALETDSRDFPLARRALVAWNASHNDGHLGQVGVSKRIRKGLPGAGLAERIDDVRKIMPPGVAHPG